jgi:hypothetical protein
MPATNATVEACRFCREYFGTSADAQKLRARHEQGHVTNAKLAGFLNPETHRKGVIHLRGVVRQERKR